MVQEADKEPKTPEPAEPVAQSGVVTPSSPALTGLRSVSAPETKPQPTTPQSNMPPGSNICAECERLIVGLFVRIREKNLHVECFKCSTCGTSLKNVGYYNINNKLYCEIHAVLVARQQCSQGYVPTTAPPKAPAGTISAALGNLGNSSPLSPPPPPLNGTSITAPFAPNHLGNPPVDPPSFRPVQPNSCNLGGPRPFGSSSVAPSPNYSSPANNNSASNNFSRPQSQTVTGRFTGLPNFPLKGSGLSGHGRTFAGSTAPKRGKGILNQASSGGRQPLCGHCNGQVRGPFITALGQIWCPDHFVCVNPQCRRQLHDIGFVQEKGQLYCEYCFERFIAPACNKCNNKIKGDSLTAIGKHYHPECFNCTYCGKLFGNSPFFLEEGLPYCEADWNELFTTKCYACGFPVEAGDRWVEALNNNYHSQCFNCTMCKKNLEGQSFYAKGGRPFCKNHAK